MIPPHEFNTTNYQLGSRSTRKGIKDGYSSVNDHGTQIIYHFAFPTILWNKQKNIVDHL